MSHTKKFSRMSRTWAFGVINAYNRLNPFVVTFEEDDAKDLEYKEWWDKQSEETRQAVSDFVRMIIRRNREDTKHMSEFGRSFMLWMQKNAHIKL